MICRGLFEDYKKDISFPPVLVVSVDDKAKFDDLVKKLDEEMFLRYHRPFNDYTKIVLLSVGDFAPSDNIPDKRALIIDISVEVKPKVTKPQEKKLDIGPFWSITFMGSDKVLAFKIDKTSEQIMDRRLISI